MDSNILIIGNTSEDYQLAAILVRAADTLNINIDSVDSNFSIYAPSMKTLLGRVFFKVTQKRPVEWWKFNRNIAAKIEENKPSIVIVTGIFPLTQLVFEVCQKFKIPIVNYLTDYPWNPNHYSSAFLKNLNAYDDIFVTKSVVVQELINFGAKRVKYLPFGYDSFVHHPPRKISEYVKEKFSTDVAFIGNADTERLPYFEALNQVGGIRVNIYGNRWDRLSFRGLSTQPSVFGDELSLATYHAKICLGILRKQNKDQSTMRTFEIAACGGCGIYEDTVEHREILAGYPEYGFFSSPKDLAEKCDYLLKNSAKLDEMRKLGIKLIVNDSNTYKARLKTILEWSLS